MLCIDNLNRKLLSFVNSYTNSDETNYVYEHCSLTNFNITNSWTKLYLSELVLGKKVAKLLVYKYFDSIFSKLTIFLTTL